MLGSIGIGLVVGWLMADRITTNVNRKKNWLAYCLAVSALGVWVYEKAGWPAAAGLGGALAAAFVVRWGWQRILRKRFGNR